MNDPKAFIEYSNKMDYAYSSINGYNPNRNREILVVLDDMIADIMTNKQFQAAIIKELFIRCKKLNISLAFITEPYFSAPKRVRINSTYYLITNIHNKRKLKDITINHSPDIDYKDFLKVYKKCISELYSFLTIDITLPGYDLLRFRTTLFDSL